jgi:hypothetical protein
LTLLGMGWAVIAALAVAAAPASVVAAGSVAMASWRGWLPRQLALAAAWCGPMIATWLVATGLSTHDWMSLLTAPCHAWLTFWRLARAGAYLRAAATIAPPAIPVGLLSGALIWSRRIGAMESGTGGLSPAASVSFDQRQWNRQVRAAKGRISAPGSVPLVTHDDLIVLGAVIRTVGHRPVPVAAFGFELMRTHQVILGTTGAGKTTLMLRMWAAFMLAGLRKHAAGAGLRPLLIVVDCKGGAQARETAERFRRIMGALGARVAIWPDENSLSLWALPPRELTTKLVELIEHGTGAAAYYKDMMQALIGLAAEAPSGPPARTAELLARLAPGWLEAEYAAWSATPVDHDLRGAARHLTDVSMRLRTLFGRLGPGFDGPGEFADADAWYCILEGIDQVAAAEVQAKAIVELIDSFIVRGSQRQIVLAVDEFSAVSRRLTIRDLCERARSLGLAVQVSVQSWQGLGETDDDRKRVVNAADGGAWLLRTPQPEPLAALAGSRRVIETTRRIGRFGTWTRQGSSRLRDEPVVDSNRARRFEDLQAAFINRGAVSYIQVKRLTADEAAAAAGGARAQAGPAELSYPRRKPRKPDDLAITPISELPDVSSVLDAAFGPELPS